MTREARLTPLTVVLVHSAYGNPEENWFPWLKAKLEQNHFKVLAPAFPTPNNQRLGTWMPILEAQVKGCTPDLMVGHSVGSALILRKLERIEQPISAAFFVSGFLGRLGKAQFDTINASFFTKPFDWALIRTNCKRFFLYNSDNDPYIPLHKGLELARKLDAKMVVIERGGHLNASSGYVRFPTLLRDILTLTKRGKNAN